MTQTTTPEFREFKIHYFELSGVQMLGSYNVDIKHITPKISISVSLLPNKRFCHVKETSQ